ncbi:MAG: zf-TFIIB domain-containing protein [Bacillota bacterium]|nr:zf-TFIIB domain-containing protein [Bacillota bacterium]
MRCLVCKDIDLEVAEIEPGLKVHRCSKCGGSWLRFDDYMEWNKQNDGRDEVSSSTSSGFVVNDSINPKLCPDCGRIMRVYKIDSSLNFGVENCGHCNGIWLDGNEWEALREKQLHNQINKFFTDTWQKKIQAAEREEYFQSFYRNKFGEEDYTKIKEIRVWLKENRNKDMLLSYLMSEDPYRL